MIRRPPPHTPPPPPPLLQQDDPHARALQLKKWRRTKSFGAGRRWAVALDISLKGFCENTSVSNQKRQDHADKTVAVLRQIEREEGYEAALDAALRMAP